MLYEIVCGMCHDLCALLLVACTYDVAIKIHVVHCCTNADRDWYALCIPVPQLNYEHSMVHDVLFPYLECSEFITSGYNKKNQLLHVSNHA